MEKIGKNTEKKRNVLNNNIIATEEYIIIIGFGYTRSQICLFAYDNNSEENQQLLPSQANTKDIRQNHAIRKYSETPHWRLYRTYPAL